MLDPKSTDKYFVDDAQSMGTPYNTGCRLTAPTERRVYVQPSRSFVSSQSVDARVPVTGRPKITPVAEWLACWTQAQKGLGSDRSRDDVG